MVLTPVGQGIDGHRMDVVDSLVQLEGEEQALVVPVFITVEVGAVVEHLLEYGRRFLWRYPVTHAAHLVPSLMRSHAVSDPKVSSLPRPRRTENGLLRHMPWPLSRRRVER